MDAFPKDGVIPDVIDSESLPAEVLKLTFGDTEVTPGMVLAPTQVKDEPSLQWNSDSNSFYTVIMNDPDAPSRENPVKGEWQHWMVCNIPGSDIGKGDAMSEYIGAGPPKGTGLHRYVFLVYKQKEKQVFEGLPKLTNRSAEKRNNQKVRETVKKYNLGQPVAGSFFQAEYDDYCPLLYKQLNLI